MTRQGGLRPSSSMSRGESHQTTFSQRFTIFLGVSLRPHRCKPRAFRRNTPPQPHLQVHFLLRCGFFCKGQPRRAVVAIDLCGVERAVVFPASIHISKTGRASTSERMSFGNIKARPVFDRSSQDKLPHPRAIAHTSVLHTELLQVVTFLCPPGFTSTPARVEIGTGRGMPQLDRVLRSTANNLCGFGFADTAFNLEMTLQNPALMPVRLRTVFGTAALAEPNNRLAEAFSDAAVDCRIWKIWAQQQNGRTNRQCPQIQSLTSGGKKQTLLLHFADG